MKCVMLTVFTKSNMLMFMCSSSMQCNASLNHLLNSPCYLCSYVCASISNRHIKDQETLSFLFIQLKVNQVLKFFFNDVPYCGSFGQFKRTCAVFITLKLLLHAIFL